MRKNMTQEMADQIGCEYAIIPPMDEVGQVLKLYEEAKEDGKQKGYVPILVVPDQELLNRMKEAEEPEYYLKEYKKHDGKEILNGYLAEIKAYLEKQGEPWEEVVSDVERGEGMNEFIGFMPDDWDSTLEVILAKIPTEHPWEVFAWVPMGGWNECPPTEYIMAVMKYWVETYGLEPVVIAQDMIEGRVPQRPETAQEACLLYTSPSPRD